MTDNTADLVRSITYGIRDLAEPQRYMTLEERQMLWDAEFLLRRVLDADLLLRVRPLHEGSQDRPRIYMDVPPVSEAGIGLPQPDAQGLEPPAVHALQEHQRRGVPAVQAEV